MRRLFTAEGKLDVAQQLHPEHPDETVAKRAKQRAEQLGETFKEAKEQVLRDDMKLARDYHALFE